MDYEEDVWERDDVTSRSSQTSINSRNIFDPPVEQHHFRFSKSEVDTPCMAQSVFTIERIRSKVSRDIDRESDLLTERRSTLTNMLVNTGNDPNDSSERRSNSQLSADSDSHYTSHSDLID
jgi:hypothetical protein